MRRSRFGGPSTILAAGCLIVAACSPVTYHKNLPSDSGVGPAKSQGHGPPDHAPAHGYRAKSHEGVELVFRSELGVYAVVDLPDHYYSDGQYFRLGKGGWLVAAKVGGPWMSIASSKIPPGLQKAKPGRSKDRAKAHTE